MALNKNIVYFVVGALLGNFFGEFIAMAITDSDIKALLTKDIETELHPTVLICP